MKLPRDLSGRRLTRMLCRRWDYRIMHQVGSHIVLQTEMPSHQRIVIPDHDVLRPGTLNGILRSVARHKSILRETLMQSL